MVIELRDGTKLRTRGGKELTFEKVNDKRWHIVFYKKHTRGTRGQVKVPVRHVVRITGIRKAKEVNHVLNE